MESTSEATTGGGPSSWHAGTPGIPDELFERTKNVPITKEEVRTIQISKARLQRGQTVLDVGCGSGSITVEAAMQVGRGPSGGRVIAIDRDDAAIALTRTNLQRFGPFDAEITLLHGDALEEIEKLHKIRADAVIIGGTGGDTVDIVRQYASIIKPGGRIVIGTILVETLYAVLQIIYDLPFTDVDITQITVSKSRRTTTGTMMLARNPVTLVSASSL